MRRVVLHISDPYSIIDCMMFHVLQIIQSTNVAVFTGRKRVKKISLISGKIGEKTKRCLDFVIVRFKRRHYKILILHLRT